VAEKVLVTLGTGAMGPVLDQSLYTFRSFADRHGYDVVVGAGDEAEGRAPAWAKVPLIRRLLDAYRLVLWIDADAIIVDDSEDPASFLAADSYQALVKHSWMGQEQPCTGVWLLRGNGRAKAFLDLIWEDDRYVQVHPWEQGSAMLALGYQSVSPGVMGTPTQWMDGTQWLDGEWDHIPILAEARQLGDCRIRHYAAVPNAIRESQMRSDRHAIAARATKGPARSWHVLLAGAGRWRWRFIYAPERMLRLRRLVSPSRSGSL